MKTESELREFVNVLRQENADLLAKNSELDHRIVLNDDQVFLILDG